MDLRGFPSVGDEKDYPILATALLEGDKDFLVLDIEIPDILSMRVVRFFSVQHNISHRLKPVAFCL